jgi:hypothetical protein
MRRRGEEGWSCPYFITLEAAMEIGIKETDEKVEVLEIPEEFKNMTLERLKNDYVKKRLYIDKEDDEIIDTILATALDRDIPGEPIWLFVIGPPGATKTELLRSLTGSRFYTTSSITAHTLITGLRDKNAKDLLPELDGKVLIIKDFTTTLQNEDELTHILAQLREAYDGYLEMNFGSGVGKKSYHSAFGLIAGVTPVIDSYTTVQNLLGERFIKVRMRTDHRKAAKKAMENVGKEKEMRIELKFATVALLNEVKQRIDNNGGKVEIPNEIEEKLLELAIFTALARSGVHRDRQRYMTVLPEAEIGTRLAKQLKKLACALALVRGKDRVSDEEFKTILRVALDSIPKKRMRILTAFFATKSDEPDGRLSSRAVGQEVKAPTATVTETLEDMWGLGLVVRYGNEKDVSWTLELQTVNMMQNSGLYDYLALCNQTRIDTNRIINKDTNTPTPLGLHSGSTTIVKVRFLRDIDTSDISLPNQPIFERVLGCDKQVKAGDVVELDPKDAEILEGSVIVIEEVCDE